MYNESKTIGMFTISHLYKIIIFTYLLYQVFFLKKSKKKEGFVRLAYFRSYKYLINGGVLKNPIFEILEFSRYILFPLFFQYLNLKAIDKLELLKILKDFSVFIILSFLPFYFGFLESQGEQIEYFEGIQNLTGIFQGPHAASITTTFSILIILYYNSNFEIKKINRWLNNLIVVFGIYIVYMTYVRTGYAMLLLGILVINFPNRLQIKDLFKYVFVLIILSYAIYFLLENNTDFYNRIFDIRNGRQKEAGSGRIIFWITAINLWQSGGYFQLLFGYGFENLTSAIFETTGYKVFAHNEFFTQLGQNGLIGVLLLMSFLISLLRYIYKYKNSNYFKLSLAMYFVYVSLMLTQGGFWFYPEFFLAIILFNLKS